MTDQLAQRALLTLRPSRGLQSTFLCGLPRQGMLATLTSLSKTCEGKRQDYPVIYSRKLKITTEILTIIAFLISKNVQSGIQKNTENWQ